MTRAWTLAVAAATLAAGVASSGCSRRYRCAARGGDTSALAAWQARGLVTDGPRVAVCEASPARFDAVYTAPPSWEATWRAVEDVLDHSGWSDSPRRGYAPRVGDRDAEATFERCVARGGGRLLECSEALRLA